MIDRAGQLWEHGSLMYYVIKRVPSDYKEYAWLAICLSDGDPSEMGTIKCLAEEFFTEQEWWERVA